MAVDGYVLRPEMMSVLVGVNDTCLNGTRPNGIPLPKYERIYRDFLSEMTSECPGLKLVLCEPFVLDCGNVAATGYSDWRAEIDERRLIVRKLCEPPGMRQNYGLCSHDVLHDNYPLGSLLPLAVPRSLVRCWSTFSRYMHFARVSRAPDLPVWSLIKHSRSCACRCLMMLAS